MIHWSKLLLMSILTGIFLLAAANVGAQEKTREQAPPAPPGKALKQAEEPPPATAQSVKKPPYAKPFPMGFISIELKSVGVGVGMEWGKGVLTYKGKKYTFKVKGLQLASVGISKVTAEGNVYNLFSIAEFPGHYSAAGADVAIFKGKEGQEFRNTKGVHIVFTGTPKGLQLAIGPEGFSIKMEEAL